MDRILQQFVEVATLKNVSHAAKKLCLSQPALTHNMKKLEESFDVPLFIRTSSGVKLTAFGEVLLEQARIIQRLHDNTRAKLKAMQERQDHALRIGSGHAWWYVFLREIIAEYSHRYPTADIRVDIGNHLREMDLLLSGDISMFIGHRILGLEPRAGVIFIPLFVSTNLFFARSGHPLAGRRCTLTDIFEFPMIELTPDEDRHAHVVADPGPKRRERLQLHLSEPVVFRSNSVMTCVDFATDSDAVLPFPVGMDGYFRARGLICLDSDTAFRKGEVGVYLTEETGEDPAIQEILGLLRTRIDAARPRIELGGL